MYCQNRYRIPTAIGSASSANRLSAKRNQESLKDSPPVSKLVAIVSSNSKTARILGAMSLLGAVRLGRTITTGLPGCQLKQTVAIAYFCLQTGS